MSQTVELYADDGGAGDPLPVVFLHSLAGNASQCALNAKLVGAAREMMQLAHFTFCLRPGTPGLRNLRQRGRHPFQHPA
jgi:hypothetical protein